VNSRRLALLVVAAWAFLACGLPKDGSPRQIADDKVPFGLLGPSTTTPGNDVAGGSLVQLFFIDGTQLRAVNRTVPNRDPKTVLGELVKGVTETDPAGITTAIPKDTQILDAVRVGDTLVVTLNNAILTVSGAEQQNAFGQLVYTATDLASAGVQFRVTDASGAQQDVQPLTDVGQKAGPLTRQDFSKLRPT
jgi:hypothetical protein